MLVDFTLIYMFCFTVSYICPLAMPTIDHVLILFIRGSKQSLVTLLVVNSNEEDAILPAAIVSPFRLSNTLPISLLSLKVSIGSRAFEVLLEESDMVLPLSETRIFADIPLDNTRGLLLIVAPVIRSRISKGTTVAGMF